MSPIHSPQRFLALLILVAALATSSYPQSPASDLPPVIKTTTHLVVLNVVVTDKSGHPVTNLKKEDFTVLENGQSQVLSTFETPMAFPSSTESGNDAPYVGSTPGGAVAVTAAQPRTILVLDELNTISEDTMFAAQKMHKYLLAQPPVLRQPTSESALNKRRLELLAEPTRDRNVLLAKLKKDFIELPPHNLESGGVQGAATRLVASLMALDEIALANAAQKGRKNVIWIGNAMTILSDTHISAVDNAKFKNWVHYTTNWLEETQTTVYTVDPRGVEVSPATVSTGGLLLSGGIPAAGIVGPDFTSSELIFESIAPESGGAILRRRNDIDVAISDAVSDGGSYYTLSYYPTNTKYDGSFRQIKVQVEPANLMARTQRGYYAYPDGFQEQNDQIDFGLSRAVMSPVEFRNIEFVAKGRIVPASGKPLQQKGTSSLRASSKSAIAAQLPAARIDVAIDRDSLSWTAQPNGDKHTEFVLVTSSVSTSGQVLDNQIHRLEFSQKKEIFDLVPPEPVKFFVFADLPPKTDHLRLVVRDSSSGHLGTFDLPASALTH